MREHLNLDLYLRTIVHGNLSVLDHGRMRVSRFLEPFLILLHDDANLAKRNEKIKVNSNNIKDN